MKTIGEQHEQLINQVNESETECRAKLMTELLPKNSLKIELLKSKNKMKLFKDNKLSSIPFHSHYYLNNNIEQKEQEIKKAKYLIKKLQDELILKKDYLFVENLDLNEFKFGTLLITDIEMNRYS